MPKNEIEKKKNMWDLGVRPSRIEALCDGVFAIAMTILVLELSLEPEIIDTLAGAHGGDFWHTFNAIYAYIMGFIVLGIYWAFHHYMFHFIKRSNGVLVWLNILLLMFAALVPLSTKVNSTYIDSYPGYVFYMGTTVITFLLLLVIWQYATRGYRLIDRDIGKEVINFVNKIIIIGSSLSIVVLIVTYFISWFGYLGFIPMGYVIIAIAYGHHKPFF
jgi:uncharacterized membrane protein